MPDEALAGGVVAALEYTDGALTRIDVTRNVDVINGFEVVKKVLPEEPSKRGPRSETVGFAVLFGDGKVIAEKSAKMTWIQALRYMGLERVAGYKGGVKGFPMVGKRKRNNSKNPRSEYQTLVDGWWVYTCLNNDQKIKHLKRIAAFLQIPLEIRRNDEAE